MSRFKRKRNRPTVRPFRIWDEAAKMPLAHRSYTAPERAIERALVLVYWLEVGNSYTVYNDHTGAVVRQFSKRIEAGRTIVRETE